MSFFDTKEEILAVELTDYGKYLLSKGKFNPKYYAFYDDDVIYDGRYANLSESQNSIQDRILKNTISSKPIANTENVINNINDKEIFTGNYLLSKKPNLNNKLLLNSLGTSDYNLQYAPAWSVSVLSGTIQNCVSGTVDKKIFYDNKQKKTYEDFIKIPQVNLKEEICYISTDQPSEEYVETLYSSEKNEFIYYLEKVLNKTFFIEEKNCENNKHNFSIEVFMQEDNNSDWQQLHFYKGSQEIKNNILLDQPEYENVAPYDDKYAVDTYLQIYLDGENIIINNSELKYNLYTSNITEEDVC